MERAVLSVRGVVLSPLAWVAALCVVVLALGWRRSLPLPRAAAVHPRAELPRNFADPGRARPASLLPVESPASAEPPTAIVAPAPAAVSTDAPASDSEEPSAQDYIDQARSQPRDEAWASAMERTLGQDLKQRAQQLGFQVGLTECFQDSCTAELFWKKLSDARAGFKATLGEPDHTQCSPRLLLSQQGNEDAPEMGVLVIDCKAARKRAASGQQIGLPGGSEALGAPRAQGQQKEEKGEQ